MLATLILTTVFGLTLAQDAAPTLTVPFIGLWDDSMLYASVVAADADATTIEIACASKSACGLFPKETIVYGPSTYHIDMSDPASDFTATADCSIGSPWIVCKETAGGSAANFPGSSTSSWEAADLTSLAVSVTAGAEKLYGVAESLATGMMSSEQAGSTSAVGEGTASATPSTTPVARTVSASGSAIASQTSGAPATVSTGAAADIGVGLAGGLIGAATGFFAAFLL